MSFDKKDITKSLVQHMFYTNLQKGFKGVCVCRKNKAKPDYFKSYRKVSNSAETVLCKVIVLISSLVMVGGSIFVTTEQNFIPLIIGIVLGVLNYILLMRFYCKSLVSVYSVILDGTDESFNKAYSKAWFLHAFYTEQPRTDEVVKEK